jgi:hypothetical protein
MNRRQGWQLMLLGVAIAIIGMSLGAALFGLAMWMLRS